MKFTQSAVKTSKIPAEAWAQLPLSTSSLTTICRGLASGYCRGRVGNRTGPISPNTNWARSIAV